MSSLWKVVFLLQLSILGTQALMCWNCTTSDLNSACATGDAPHVDDAEERSYETEDQELFTKMTCNSSLGTMVCGKTLAQTVDKVTYVSRGCNYGYKKGCSKNKLLGRVAIVCFCKKDFCNSAFIHFPRFNLLISFYFVRLMLI
ncbi:uncharacterized protein [Watersipora subatra]|uniref:uncharacterized protein isoform X2 n=1 Tax=Watersipora subatra TaxID=2589382 RepID=UPI00355B427D